MNEEAEASTTAPDGTEVPPGTAERAPEETAASADTPESAPGFPEVPSGVSDATAEAGEVAEVLPGAAEAALPEIAEVSPGMAARAIELLEVGGPVVAILLVLSVAALAIVFVKLIQFRVHRLGDRRPARRAIGLWRSGRAEEALSCVRGSRNPVAQALARAMRGQRRGLPESKVREEVVRHGGDVLATLRSWFRPLEVIASLAPLLGLFGTVLGMIAAFRQLEAAGNQVDPAILSGGIWEALLTTAVGLAVAIPTVVVLNWLERRVDRLAHEMDSIVTQVFTEDLSEGVEAALQQEDIPRNAPARFRATATAGE